MLRATALEVGGAVDDDLVDAGLLRVDLRLPRVLFQPAAVGGAAGEVDDAHLGPQRELLRDVAACLVREQRDDVRIEAGLGEHFARDLAR